MIAALLGSFDASIAAAYRHGAPPLSARFSEEPIDLEVRAIGAAANLRGLPERILATGRGWDRHPTAVSLTGRVDVHAAVLAAGSAFQRLTARHRDWPPEVSDRAESEHATSAERRIATR